MTRTTTILIAALAALIAPHTGLAQSLGTIRWQFQPYCNVLTATVTQVRGIYRLEGTDDQCGGGRDLASVVGVAFPNPDGGIGFGMTIVTAPGGESAHLTAEITLGTLSGTWRASPGISGAFVFTPGAPIAGYPRPNPTPTVPAAIQLMSTGALVASGALNVGTAPASGPGVRMMWHPGLSAFRAGEVLQNPTAWDEANVGRASAAFGANTTARGFAGTAMGYSTTAGGQMSVAMGRDTIASGDYSLAMGSSTTAGGNGSLAGGLLSAASGHLSVALGDRTVAAGLGSIALGSNAVTAAAAAGSFVFADRSSTNQVFSLHPNEFVVRVAGGARFFSHPTNDVGPALLPGDGAWSSVSDVRMKEHFRNLNGDDVLARIAEMPVREWNYKTQDAAIRHMGPTAQDFRAAFGLGDSDVRINTIDADGVALASVKALEARTRALQAEVEALRRQLDALIAKPQ